MMDELLDEVGTLEGRGAGATWLRKNRPQLVAAISSGFPEGNPGARGLSDEQRQLLRGLAAAYRSIDARQPPSVPLPCGLPFLADDLERFIGDTPSALTAPFANSTVWESLRSVGAGALGAEVVASELVGRQDAPALLAEAVSTPNIRWLWKVPEPAAVADTLTRLGTSLGRDAWPSVRGVVEAGVPYVGLKLGLRILVRTGGAEQPYFCDGVRSALDLPPVAFDREVARECLAAVPDEVRQDLLERVPFYRILQGRQQEHTWDFILAKPAWDLADLIPSDRTAARVQEAQSAWARVLAQTDVPDAGFGRSDPLPEEALDRFRRAHEAAGS